MTTEMTINEDKPLTAADIRKQVNTIQHVLKDVMKQNVHFGRIPGTQDPTLYKPGAEKIMATFRLAAEPEVTDLSDGDQIRYMVKVRLISSTGVFVGAGIGECSSNEEKYKWRRAICDEEFDETEPERCREKWIKGNKNQNPFKLKQIRTEPADLANTILKMAKKRGLIDAVLTATAASDIFSQDIEDLPPEYINGDDAPPAQGQQQQANKEPPRRSSSNDQNPDGPINANQVNLLKRKLQQAGKTENELCSAFEIDQVEALPFKHINDAIDWVET